MGSQSKSEGADERDGATMTQPGSSAMGGSYFAPDHRNRAMGKKRNLARPTTPLAPAVVWLGALLLLARLGVDAFTAPSRQLAPPRVATQSQTRPPSTALNVWWFGGTGGESETSTSGEECELVAVRIDRTSPNSRRIAGEIVVNASLMDVWAILTDYDNLSTHVPNLVASKRISDQGGEGGDGSHRCRLYQRGAQKIIGFEFGADVTMDMTESIVVAGKSGRITKSHEAGAELGATEVHSPGLFLEERQIGFKCVDSQFFLEFDGTWRVVQMPDNPFTGEKETTVSYTVDVRPKGPVPVGALEWRIREDVPTNLRAVKKAAIEVGAEGVYAKRNGGRLGKALAKLTGNAGRAGEEEAAQQESSFADFILDYENETLGAYLE